ncbi:hypothetical protein C8J57DRAFT_1574870 [Mycena rebaudengoi]|nr:hypothetical protein C8J57DRAFT_1574870 [Mycena rebaudengoi]
MALHPAYSARRSSLPFTISPSSFNAPSDDNGAAAPPRITRALGVEHLPHPSPPYAIGGTTTTATSVLAQTTYNPSSTFPAYPSSSHLPIFSYLSDVHASNPHSPSSDNVRRSSPPPSSAKPARRSIGNQYYPRHSDPHIGASFTQSTLEHAHVPVIDSRQRRSAWLVSSGLILNKLHAARTPPAFTRLLATLIGLCAATKARPKDIARLFQGLPILCARYRDARLVCDRRPRLPLALRSLRAPRRCQTRRPAICTRFKIWPLDDEALKIHREKPRAQCDLGIPRLSCRSVPQRSPNKLPRSNFPIWTPRYGGKYASVHCAYTVFWWECAVFFGRFGCQWGYTLFAAGTVWRDVVGWGAGAGAATGEGVGYAYWTTTGAAYSATGYGTPSRERVYGGGAGSRAGSLAQRQYATPAPMNDAAMGTTAQPPLLQPRVVAVSSASTSSSSAMSESCSASEESTSEEEEGEEERYDAPAYTERTTEFAARHTADFATRHCTSPRSRRPRRTTGASRTREVRRVPGSSKLAHVDRHTHAAPQHADHHAAGSSSDTQHSGGDTRAWTADQARKMRRLRVIPAAPLPDPYRPQQAQQLQPSYGAAQHAGVYQGGGQQQQWTPPMQPTTHPEQQHQQQAHQQQHTQQRHARTTTQWTPPRPAYAAAGHGQWTPPRLPWSGGVPSHAPQVASHGLAPPAHTHVPSHTVPQLAPLAQAPMPRRAVFANAGPPG